MSGVGSFAAISCTYVVCLMFANLLARAFGAGVAEKRKRASNVTAIRHADTLERHLNMAKHIAMFLTEEYGEEIVHQLKRKDKRARFPKGFWKKFINEELRLCYSNRQRQKCYRAWEIWVERTSQGQKATFDMLNGDEPSAKRRKGGSKNSKKAPGLGHALLQCFVDGFQVLRSRADSSLLMEQLRGLYQYAKDSGVREEDLPQLEGSAGKSWFFRWRREYHISQKACGMQLKVAWVKILKRCKIFLTNIWRVKHFWELCHKGKTLRWLSADQKPLWFNNAGHKGALAIRGQKAPMIWENFSKTRERLSLFTFVDSSCMFSPTVVEEDAPPPPLFVLFKGKKSGHIIKHIKDTLKEVPPWFHIQVQDRLHRHT